MNYVYQSSRGAGTFLTGLSSSHVSNNQSSAVHHCVIELQNEFKLNLKPVMRTSGRVYNYNLIIVAANIAVFFLVYLSPGILEYLAIYAHGLLLRKFLWTPITYMFTHSGFMHIIFNMIVLISIGHHVERHLGSGEYLAYYLICGALAGVFSVVAYMSRASFTPIIGASGAIYAVLLAYAILEPRAVLLLFGLIPMRAPILLAVFAAIDLLSHVFQFGGNAAHLTHLSGLAFGLLYFSIRLRINPIKAMRNWH